MDADETVEAPLKNTHFEKLAILRQAQTLLFFKFFEIFSFFLR